MLILHSLGNHHCFPSACNCDHGDSDYQFFSGIPLSPRSLLLYKHPKVSTPFSCSTNRESHALLMLMFCIILNAGSLSSELFLLWACLIEEGS